MINIKTKLILYKNSGIAIELMTILTVVMQMPSTACNIFTLLISYNTVEY